MAKAKAKCNESSPIDQIDRTIHSPARLKILAFMAVVDKADFTFLMNQTGLTRGNLSSHLGVLEEANYINVEKTFVEKIPRTLIQINAAGRQAMEDYRENMRNVLDGLLGGGR